MRGPHAPRRSCVLATCGVVRATPPPSAPPPLFPSVFERCGGGPSPAQWPPLFERGDAMHGADDPSVVWLTTWPNCFRFPGIYRSGHVAYPEAATWGQGCVWVGGGGEGEGGRGGRGGEGRGREEGEGGHKQSGVRVVPANLKS